MATPTPPAKPGDRVKLIHCADPYSTIASGTLGTVTLVDHLGTTHISWDNDIQLGLVNDEDSFVILNADG